ncbi:FAD-dependent oxidoreductase, partial [Cribrihabitans sp. XS_ASV171]
MHDVIVMGGGMVGVSSALALQERGLDVALLDRGDPAARSSYGNAGIIQVEAAEPYAMPRSMGELAAIAFRRSNA